MIVGIFLIFVAVVIIGSVAAYYGITYPSHSTEIEKPTVSTNYVPQVASPMRNQTPPYQAETPVQKQVAWLVPSSTALAAEMDVDEALRTLYKFPYFVFRDLIIPTGNTNLTLTQIDHVVVSHFGIFCIETKSHKGSIYGNSRSENWKQYLGSNKPYTLRSPFKQNKHHIRALEHLLTGQLRAPVHSYIAFPNARKVMVDGIIENMTPYGVVDKVARHTEQIYGDSEVEYIAKILAHAGTFREQLRNKHAHEVREYLDAKVSKTLRYS